MLKAIRIFKHFNFEIMPHLH